MASTITDLFQQYDAGCDSETPARTIDELRALWHAADCRYNDEADETAFWTLVFGGEECNGCESWAWNDGGEFPTNAQWAAFETERDALRAEDAA